MDVPQSDYWHVSLKGWGLNVIKAMGIFPSLTVTQNKGLLYKNIRAYHQGGANLIYGLKAEETCLECEFPSASTVKSLEHYLPVGAIGFEFWKDFETESHARSFKEAVQFTAGAEVSQLNLTSYHAKIEKFGRVYTSDHPISHKVFGIIADSDVQKMLKFYGDLAKGDFVNGRLGNLKFSTHPHCFVLEKAFDF